MRKTNTISSVMTTLCVVVAFIIGLFGLSLSGCTPARMGWRAVVSGGKANHDVQEKAHAVPRNRLASAHLEGDTAPVVDWHGDLLVIKDTAQLARLMDALEYAERLTDFAVSNETGALVLCDAKEEELARFDMSVNSSTAFYGHAWGTFLQDLKREQARHVASALADLPTDSSAMEIRVARGYLDDGMLEFTDPVTRKRTKAEIAKAKQGIVLQSPTAKTRLVALLRSGNPRLFSYDAEEGTDFRIYLKTGGKERSVVVVLPVEHSTATHPTVVDPTLAPDAEGTHLLCTLAPLLKLP